VSPMDWELMLVKISIFWLNVVLEMNSNESHKA
jgi:hypothetical protein